MKLSKKKAIVTGANRSIGQAIAIAFAREGADVVISYRSDEQGAKRTVQAIEEAGRHGKAIHGDFNDPHSVETFFKKAVEFLGSVDILVNNAALYDTSELFQISFDDFEKSLRVNVSVPMLLSQLTAKHMIQKKQAGSIINISSITGNRPYPNRIAFAASKAALNMLTQSMALDLGPHQIRVNGISPGSVPYEKTQETSELIPLRRMGTPEDQANAAVYLASEDASWVTGQILAVDGGQSLSYSFD